MKSYNKAKAFTVFLTGATVILLAGCSGIKTEAKYPENRETRQDDADIYGKQETIFGKEGGIFGKRKKEDSENAIGINSYLWRATLDTISFMPLASADPFGGVILTDWYSSAETPNERIKINAFILGRELKSDGIRVKTFRQVMKGGAWKDAPAAEGTDRKLEDAILTRARELRIAKLGN